MTRDELLKQIVEHQANMETLWLSAPTFGEAMLQSALRHLHAAIEGDLELAEQVKKQYWNLESETVKGE